MNQKDFDLNGKIRKHEMCSQPKTILVEFTRLKTLNLIKKKKNPAH